MIFFKICSASFRMLVFLASCVILIPFNILLFLIGLVFLPVNIVDWEEKERRQRKKVKKKKGVF